MPLIPPPVTIWSAAKEGKLDELQRFVDQGTAVDSRGRGEVTPLHEAAEAGHTDVVLWLLDRGASPNARTLRNAGDPGLYTPLHLAVQAGHIDVARLLVQRGAKVNARMSDGTTSLMLAAESGRMDLLALLFEHCADISLHSQLGQSAFSIAVVTQHLAAAEVFIQKGADVNDRSEGDNGTVLMLMAGDKQVEAVRFLLAHHADVHILDDKGQNALHWAVIGAAAHVRKWTSDESGRTFEEDNPEDGVRVIRMLLSAGALATVAAVDGFTPVSLARKLRLTHIVEVLEQKGPRNGG
jgi:ankyrin repeat protein